MTLLSSPQVTAAPGLEGPYFKGVIEGKVMKGLQGSLASSAWSPEPQVGGMDPGGKWLPGARQWESEWGSETHLPPGLACQACGLRWASEGPGPADKRGRREAGPTMNQEFLPRLPPAGVGGPHGACALTPFALQPLHQTVGAWGHGVEVELGQPLAACRSPSPEMQEDGVKSPARGPDPQDSGRGWGRGGVWVLPGALECKG